MKRLVIVALISSFLVLGFRGCGGPPQIGADKESFKTVDALYTAVGLKDSKLVDQCNQKLKTLHDADRLPEGASRSLESIIAETRDGKWEDAQAHLSRFMEGQRR
jgi:hypothetical protein